MPLYQVSYEVYSGCDNGARSMGGETLTMPADSEAEAVRKTVNHAHTHDLRTDPRVDPLVRAYVHGEVEDTDELEGTLEALRACPRCDSLRVEKHEMCAVCTDCNWVGVERSSPEQEKKECPA